MDQTREERLQQRLRGAQRREITNVDFGLFLPPAPVAPVVPALAKQPNQSQTPLPPELPSQPSTRRSPRAHGRPANANLPTVTPSANDANTSAKRRKLDSDEVAPLSSGRSTRSSQALPRPDIYDLPADDRHSEPAAETSQVSVEQISEISAVEQDGATVVQAVIQQVEATESRDEATPPADSDEVVAQPEVPPPVVPEESRIKEVESVVHIPRKKRKRAEPIPNPVSPDEPQRRSARGVHAPSGADEIDELSPQLKRRRRRAEVEDVSRADRGSVNKEPEEDVQDEAVATNDVEAAATLKKNRDRRTSRGSPQVELDEELAPEVVLPKNQRGRRRVHSSPIQQLHPKPKQTKLPVKEKASKKPNKEARVRLGSPIPVTVHRLTKRLQYDEDESDADILNSEIPYAKHGGVNAVDVLSQFCQEIVNSVLETLEHGATNTKGSALKREYKTKYRAVEAFGREIETRLLEHAINIDNGRALKRRVRDEQKKKLALREEILRVRAEREQVALRMDEIRIKHEEEKQKANERDTLNNAVHDIELAIERGKQAPSDDVEMTGIELLLKRVAGKVSSKSDEGGILKRIQVFNAFLERTALALKA